MKGTGMAHNRFAIVASYIVPGTEQKVYAQSITNLEFAEITGISIVDLSQRKEGEGDEQGDEYSKTLKMIVAKIFDDETCTKPTFTNTEDVEAAWSMGQIRDCGSFLLGISGFGGGTAAAAERFQHGERSSGLSVDRQSVSEVFAEADGTTKGSPAG
jgi:hypothetical protein